MLSTNIKFGNFTDLLIGLTEKELRTRYKFTVLGFFWIALNPILQMLIIGFVFTFFIRNPIENYYYYLFIGLLVWNFFSLSLTRATQSIVWERTLIKKAAFPKVVIPLSIVLSNLFHLIIAMTIFAIPVSFLGTISFEGIIYIFLAFLLLLTFTIGASLLTSALNVRYRDINFFVQALIMIWFYATPIIYTLSMIPYKFYWLWRLNPMTSILQLLQHGFLNQPLPGIGMFTINLVIIAAVFTLGIIIFNKEGNNFDDWI
jgi:ABC-2 type transport system permease protein